MRANRTSWAGKRPKKEDDSLTMEETPGDKYGEKKNKGWEKYIKGKSINGLPMHAEHAYYGLCRKKCFIFYVSILHVYSLVSIDTYV